MCPVNQINFTWFGRYYCAFKVWMVYGRNVQTSSSREIPCALDPYRIWNSWRAWRITVSRDIIENRLKNCETTARDSQKISELMCKSWIPRDSGEEFAIFLSLVLFVNFLLWCGPNPKLNHRNRSRRLNFQTFWPIYAECEKNDERFTSSPIGSE
jgi:hypothetical protein